VSIRTRKYNLFKHYLLSNKWQLWLDTSYKT
jgi:hypothetical protein